MAAPCPKEDTRTGTIGRDLIAAPVAIAADTPHIEMPDASGAAHSRQIQVEQDQRRHQGAPQMSQRRVFGG